MSDLVGRRAFGQALALGSLSAASLSAVSLSALRAQEPKPEKPASEKPAEPQAEVQRSPVELLLEMVQQGEKRKLEPEQLAAIRRDLERQLVRSRIMSRFPLTNADEPGVHFAAWRAAEPG